jgi:hypothetical protein
LKPSAWLIDAEKAVIGRCPLVTALSGRDGVVI